MKKNAKRTLFRVILVAAVAVGLVLLIDSQESVDPS